MDRRMDQTLFRKAVLGSPKAMFTAHQTSYIVTLWSLSEIQDGESATHVYIHLNPAMCNRMEGIGLPKEDKVDIFVPVGQTLYAMTEDQAILMGSARPF